MRNDIRWTAIAFAAVLALGSSAAAGAAQDKEAIVKQRQDTMKRQSDDATAINKYAKGELDQETAIAKVNDMLAISPEIVDLFPPGTSQAELGDKATKALPDIWRDWDKFKTLPVTLHGEEEKLAAAIKSGDRDAARTQLVNTFNNACNVCHNAYRAGGA